MNLLTSIFTIQGIVNKNPDVGMRGVFSKPPKIDEKDKSYYESGSAKIFAAPKNEISKEDELSQVFATLEHDFEGYGFKKMPENEGPLLAMLDFEDVILRRRSWFTPDGKYIEIKELGPLTLLFYRDIKSADEAYKDEIKV